MPPPPDSVGPTGVDAVEPVVVDTAAPLPEKASAAESTDGASPPAAAPVPDTPEQPAAPVPPPAEAAELQPRRRLLQGRAFVIVTSGAATVIAVVSLLIVLREPILAVLPATHGFYDVFGLAPDPIGAGLEIREIASVRERYAGANVLTVTGIVANIVHQPAPLPALRVSLYDEADQEVQFITLPSERPSLAPGEMLRFDARIPDPRPEARRVRVGFIPPQS